MTDVEQWCIDQEYIGIENNAERSIKIFYDYKQSHSYDDYVKLVKEEHTDTADVRSLVFVDDFLNSLTQVYCDGTIVGEIVLKDDNLQFKSYEGIGDEEYPVIDNVPTTYSSQEEVVKSYQQFDRYVLDGEYLLDKSRKNTIDNLYLRMIRNSHELPQKLQC